MNLLQRQGFLNSLILYVGIALGFFNLIILFQRFLTIEQIGFFNLMIAITPLYAQFASFGVSNVILKYFPYYKSEDKKHGGFIGFVSLWALTGFIVFTILFLLFKDSIILFYQQKKGANLLVEYFYYLVPLSFLTMVFAILESLASTVFKNVLPSFLREVILRLFTLGSVLLIAWNLINYHDFLMIYAIAYGILILILFFSIYRGNDFRIVAPGAPLLKDRKNFINYGFYTVLSNSSYQMIQSLDIIMLSLLSSQSLIDVGIYSTFFSIALVINLPSKALSRTSLQIVSQYWAANDLGKINKIYYKTSVVQMLIGCLLFIWLIINKEMLVILLHKPEYAHYFPVFIVVGLAFLVDITGGLNGYIMNLSRYYRLTTVFIVISVFICVLLNWLLIPHIGIMGAALSYFITVFLLNFAYWLFVKLKFNLQPFGRVHIFVFLMFGLCLLTGLYLPVLKDPLPDAIYRSVIVGVLYAAMAYFLKISEDINAIIDRILGKKTSGTSIPRL